MELIDAIRLYPADLPELGASATAEDIGRAAEALASVIHRRAAVTLVATAWKERTDALRARGGRPHYGEGQRADFVDRFVAEAMTGADARAEVVAMIEARLRAIRLGLHSGTSSAMEG